MKEILRQNALVKLEKGFAEHLKDQEPKNLLLEDEIFVFLGEIPNMPEHCVVAGHKSGRVYSGYHATNFQELDEDEV